LLIAGWVGWGGFTLAREVHRFLRPDYSLADSSRGRSYTGQAFLSQGGDHVLDP